MNITAILIAACSWANPGADPYQGRPADAVEHYTDIPAEHRAVLKSKLERRAYDDVAEITRDDIVGHHPYTDLRQMWFGRNTVCSRPDRSAWSPTHTERGLVYCSGEHCVIVPTVCRNVSRVTRLARTQELKYDPPGAGPASGGGGSTGLAFSTTPLTFAPLAIIDPVPSPPSLTLSRSGEPWLPPGAWAPSPPPIYLLPPLPPRVPIVPEPGTWLLMLAGLALLIFKNR